MLPGCVAAVSLPLQELHSPPDVVFHQRSYVVQLVQAVVAGGEGIVAPDVKLVTERIQQNLDKKNKKNIKK